jgi:hypothetical protein
MRNDFHEETMRTVPLTPFTDGVKLAVKVTFAFTVRSPS